MRIEPHARVYIEPYPNARRVAFEPGLPVRPLDGYTMREFRDRHMFFGGVQAVQWCPGEGLAAVADSPRSGVTA
ncbi:MAG: hypothetical protein OEM83_06515 [Gammaproteobacteria bacterium]|nr:hypothetical protein [Gammaproteobacteria bacterium]